MTRSEVRQLPAIMSGELGSVDSGRGGPPGTLAVAAALAFNVRDRALFGPVQLQGFLERGVQKKAAGVGTAGLSQETAVHDEPRRAKLGSHVSVRSELPRETRDRE